MLKSPSVHLTLYPEGPHPLQIIFEEVESGLSLAQESMLLNSPEMRSLPLHESLGYERVSPFTLLIMAIRVTSLIGLGQDARIAKY